jgi:hypothetical protein
MNERRLQVTGIMLLILPALRISSYAPKATTRPYPSSSSPVWNLIADVKLPALIERSEATSIAGKAELTQGGQKKNVSSSAGLDMGSLCLIIAGLVGLIFRL